MLINLTNVVYNVILALQKMMQNCKLNTKKQI